MRWCAGASGDARAALLERAALSLASSEGERPGPAINNTDGLWWVRGAGDAASFAAAIDLLESSDIVEWASPAYRSTVASPAASAAGAPAADEQAAYFAVNPTRILVREDAMDVLGGTDAIGDVALDEQRATRIPGLVALRVQQPSALAGRTALHAAERIASSLRSRSAAGTDRAVRFEHIPYRSPTCLGGDCRPPTASSSPTTRCSRPMGPRAHRGAAGMADRARRRLDHRRGARRGRRARPSGPRRDPQSWNASTDTPDGSPTGDHGTACAGIAAARLDNAQGVSASAAAARVMAIATATWADIDIAEGLYFAADNGARVVSMSFGVYPSWESWDFDIVRDALQYAHDKGVVLVAASGNEDGPEARFPGSDARTICVGGSNRERRAQARSAMPPASRGGARATGPSLSVVAPCLENPTTDRLGGDGYARGRLLDGFNGTSSATPHVAGLAALILSLRPSLSARRGARDPREHGRQDLAGPMPTPTIPPSRTGRGTRRSATGASTPNGRCSLRARPTPAEHDDGCSGCGGTCCGETPEECRGPAPIPWLGVRSLHVVLRGARVRRREARRPAPAAAARDLRALLCMVGRQQGPLLFTTTLLPGESVQLYEFDRYRRTRAETQRMSVHTSFRQTMSALSQSRRADSAQAYRDNLSEVREHADSSVSVGGGLAGAFGR